MVRRDGLVVVLGLLLATSAVSQQIPVGTVFPIMSGNTVDSAKSKSGNKLSGKLMQDLVLPSGEVIRAGSKIEGQILELSRPVSGKDSRLVVRFDRLVFDGKSIPMNVSLRALASMQDVFEAQLPYNSFDDYGTSSSDWNTVQVGGAVVYRGDGTVRSAMDVVGRATDYGAVTAKLMPNRERGCLIDSANGEREQGLWVFSPWACGTYGFDELKIVHHGASSPVGAIVLSAPRSVLVRGGSGWLLQVVATESDFSLHSSQ